MTLAVSRSTIPTGFADAVALGTVDKQTLLGSIELDSARLAALRRRSQPCAVVVLHGLYDAGPPGEAAGQPVADPHQPMVSPQYGELVRVPLYDLSAAGKADVLRVGRHPSQDLQLLDMQVSREHGLIIYRASSVVYSDYGTLVHDEAARAMSNDEIVRADGRHGSMNGTRLNELVGIQNQTVRWSPRDFLGVGQQRKSSGGALLSLFKLTYHSLLPTPGEQGRVLH